MPISINIIFLNQSLEIPINSYTFIVPSNSVIIPLLHFIVFFKNGTRLEVPNTDLITLEPYMDMSDINEVVNNIRIYPQCHLVYTVLDIDFYNVTSLSIKIYHSFI